MKSVCVCRSCGRTIESEFIYCPWCGLSRLQEDDKHVLDNVFRQMEEKQAEDRDRRLHRLEEELEILEKDLNVLVLSSEMHK
ncbi:MAG: zinc ribbon domain-containing protein [Treponema sp.]|nr:zinc ribbon domain-containing protein [Treponema sp.]